LYFHLFLTYKKNKYMTFSPHQTPESIILELPAAADTRLLIALITNLVIFLACHFVANALGISAVKSLVSGAWYVPFENCLLKLRFYQSANELLNRCNSARCETNENKKGRIEQAVREFIDFKYQRKYIVDSVRCLAPHDRNALEDEINEKIPRTARNAKNGRRRACSALRTVTEEWKSLQFLDAFPLVCMLAGFRARCVPLAALTLALSNASTFLHDWACIAMNDLAKVCDTTLPDAPLSSEVKRSHRYRRRQYKWWRCRCLMTVLLLAGGLFALLHGGEWLPSDDDSAPSPSPSPSPLRCLIFIDKLIDLRSSSPSVSRTELIAALLLTTDFLRATVRLVWTVIEILGGMAGNSKWWIGFGLCVAVGLANAAHILHRSQCFWALLCVLAFAHRVVKRALGKSTNAAAAL
jgi:hypothetical protein